MTTDRGEIDEAPSAPRWPILLILLAALVVRLVGIGYGLPRSFDFEEEKNVSQAFRHTMVFRAERLKPDKPDNPPLTSYVLAGAYGALYGVGYLAGRIGSLAEYRYYFLASPGVFYVLARLSSIAFGLVSIYLLYRVCRKATDWGVAILASIFLALSPHHVHFSQLATGDMLALVFLLGGLYHLVDLCAERRFAAAMYAALLFGLAAGTAFEYAVFLLLFYFAYFIVVPRDYKVSATLIGLFFSTLCFLGGACLPNVRLLFSAPELARAFADRVTASISLGGLSSLSRALASLRELVDVGIFGRGLGPAVAAAGLAGLVWAIVSMQYKRRRFFVMLAFLVIPVVLFFPDGSSVLKWAFLMTPALATGAAFLVYRLCWRRGISAALGAGLMVVLAATISAQGALTAAAGALRRSGDDTRWRYAVWARKSLPDGARILATTEARFLDRAGDLEWDSPRWREWRPKVLSAWNNRAFHVSVLPVPPGDWAVPPPEAFDYIALDTWSLRRLEVISSGAGGLKIPFLPFRRDQRAKAAGFLALFDLARRRGEILAVIPEAPPGLRGYGPGIEVVKMPEPEPAQ